MARKLLAEELSMNLLVTGGAGFIGSHFAEFLIRRGHRVAVLDLLTYAGHKANVPAAALFIAGSISSEKPLWKLFSWFEPDAVFNFAAESHVCRSISEPESFIRSNIKGTYSLLQAALKQYAKNPNFRYVQVSTDEVFGDLGPEDAPFTEDSPYAPHSPYAASKASADHLVRAWHHTYGLPTIITHCSNNYGIRQHPEKLIPAQIRRALCGQYCEIHGSGGNIRDWIHVSDHCAGVWAAYERGTPGRSYCFGGRTERSTEQVTKQILSVLGYPQTLLRFVPDRPGNDRRYAIDDSRARAELGWTPQRSFDEALKETAQWYSGNQLWCDLMLNPSRNTSKGLQR